MQRHFAWFSLVVILCAAGCGQQLSQEELIKRGDKLEAEGKTADAVVAYRAAVAADDRDGEARLKLGLAYGKAGDWGRATDQLVRAADLMPSNESAQLEAARGLLTLGRFEDARTRAEGVLKTNPKNVLAHVLRASATAGLRDTEGALTSMRAAIELDPTRANSYVDVGAIQAAEGKSAEAEAAFKQAVNVGPKSVQAHLALANFYWASNRRAEAEQALEKAVAIEPTHPAANLALAGVYSLTGRGADAEAPLKRVAGESAPPALRLMLADYYMARKRGPEARSILQALLKQPESAPAAGARLAAIEYEGGKRADAHKMLDDLIAKGPNAQLSVLKARWLFAEGKPREALDAANAAVKMDDKSADAWAFLGSVHVALNDAAEAENAYTQALQANPRFVAAQIALTNLNAARGRTEQAVSMARQAVQQAPSSGAARLSLANALLAAGDVEGAEGALQPAIDAAPNSPDALVLLGRVQRRKGNLAAAQAAFTKALQERPGSAEALTPLIAMDLDAKRPDQAARRIEAHLTKGNDSASLRLLAGRTYAAAGDLAKSEQALRKAIELDPSLMEAYHVLGQIFARQKKLPEAVAAYEARLAERPNDVGAHTMIGMLKLAQGNGSDARARFEKVLAIDSRAAVASNNLAYMDAEAGTNLDVALNRAQTAKAALPNEPDVDDTLGWVYVKRGLPALAITPLRQAADKNPSNPTYHYHLGVAYAKNGNNEQARASLQRALKLSPSFDGADVARQTLNGLRP